MILIQGTKNVSGKEELVEIVPSDVQRYPLHKAFEDPFPGDDARPIAARASSLKKAKSGWHRNRPSLRATVARSQK